MFYFNSTQKSTWSYKYWGDLYSSNKFPAQKDLPEQPFERELNSNGKKTSAGILHKQLLRK